jgi:hypothetical protein
MTLKGKIETNVATGIVSFDATTATVLGTERPSREHHELSDLVETEDQGTYTCQNTHGRIWTLIDYEDEAELIPAF